MTTESPIAYSINPRDAFTFYAAHIREPKFAGFTHQKRVRPEWVCFLPIRGELELIDFHGEEKNPYTVPPGHLHIIPPGMPQTFGRAMQKNDAFIWWHFFGPTEHKHWDPCTHNDALALIDQQLEENQQRRWLVPVQTDLNHCLGEIGNLHKQLCDIQIHWGPDDHGATALIKHILHRLHQEFSSSLIQAPVAQQMEHGNSDERHTRRAQWLIRFHYQRLENLSAVASELDLNPAYLARCCKRVLGKSIGDIILEQRIRAAQDLMRSDQYSLKEIAHQSGFTSLNYFCRRFKQLTGHTASEWRDRKLTSNRQLPSS